MKSATNSATNSAVNSAANKFCSIVLIDDDTSFGLIMKQLAKQRGVHLDYFPSLGDLGYVALLGKYGVAILDYDLGGMTGLEISDYMQAFFANIPTLIVSATLRQAVKIDKNAAMPRPFVHKDHGYEAILTTALSLAGEPEYINISKKFVGLGVA